MMLWGHEALRIFLTTLSSAMDEIQIARSTVEQAWNEVLTSRKLCTLIGQLKADQVKFFRKKRNMGKTFSGDMKQSWQISKSAESNCKAAERR